MRFRVLVCVALTSLVPSLALGQDSPFGPARQVTGSITIDPSFSPDGARMVYITAVAGVQQLFIAKVDGSEPKQITNDAFDHEDPAWSPDSKSLVYCTTDDLDPPRKDVSDLFRIDVSTRQITKLTTAGINTYPLLSPDGKRIAFRKIIDELNSEVFVMDADGSDYQNLANDPAYDGWPVWSPVGTKIAFASNRRGNHRIYVMDADGKNVLPIVHDEGRATAPAWTPDRKSIYFPICARKDGIAGCEIFAAKVN